MKRNNGMLRLLMVLGSLALLQITASANSSWRWISEARPFDVLPWVVLGTVAVETAAITAAKLQPVSRTLMVVIAANILSFAASYVVPAVAGPVGFQDNLQKMIDHWPTYNVGVYYLVMTLAVELPAVYCMLKKHTQQKRLLLFSVLGSNVLTTVLTALAERLFCRGVW